MKKLSVIGSIVTLLLPGLVFAAYNDVSLTTDVDLSVNGITVDVTGSTATIESIEVGSTSFTVTLQSGSSIKVSPEGYKQMSYDMTYTGSVTPQVDYICTAATSTLLMTASSQATLTVTPLGAACSGPGESTSGSSSPGSSGGGGGGVVTVTTPVVAPQSAEITTLMAQIATLQAQIAARSGVTLPSTASATAKAVLTANLSKGARNASVKGLQQFLNTHGFVIASSGPGSVGKETDMFGSLTVKAVQKFQEQYGIATPSTPGYGNVGPKTRAKINELSAN